MNPCTSARERFSDYLDGVMTGVAMQQVAAHLESCGECRGEFEGWREMQTTLSGLGPAKAPPGLGLRLRVTLSQEQARTPRQSLARWQMRWQNSLAPFLLRASVLLVGSVALLVGAFAAPQAVEARDEPTDFDTSPHFLYSMLESSAPDQNLLAARPQHARSRVAASRSDKDGSSDAALRADTAPNTGSSDQSVVVEAYVNGAGRVYDYRIVSGPRDAAARAQVENLLLFSVFAPATIFGEPVRGIAVVSFSGVSVQG
jgi:hypothetical protein